MLRKLNSASKAGFTLVEIMIVVAIIALLAAIAVPNFLRARKRSQATAILEEMRLIDGAKDQYAIETNKAGGAAVGWEDVRVHLKASSALANRSATAALDTLGNPIVIGNVDDAPTLDVLTTGNFADIVSDEFWGSYK